MQPLMTTSGAVSAIVPEVWSQMFREELHEATPFQDLIARDYEGEMKKVGDTVHIPVLPEDGDAGVLPEGTAGSATALTASTVDLVVNKRIYRDYIITSEAELQSIEFMEGPEGLRVKAFRSIMRGIQNEIIAAIAPSASAPDHAIAYDSGTTLAVADILEIKDLLDAANVPMDGRSVVFGTAQENDLLALNNFLSREFGKGGSQQSGRVSEPIYSFMPRGTTAVGTTSYFFHRSFMQMAVQKDLNMKLYDLGGDGTRAFRLNFDILLGIKQIDNLRVATLT